MQPTVDLPLEPNSDPEPEPEPTPVEPTPIPPPLPDLPPGAILVTFQANIGGYPPTTAVIAPRMAHKMMRRVHDEGAMVDGVFVPKYAGLTDMFMMHVRQTLFSDLNARYPDPDQEIAALEERLAEMKIARMNQPEFLGGGE